MQRILELDYAIREALGAADSEAVLRLTDEHHRAIQEQLDTKTGAARERLIREAADLLAQQIKLAHQVRDDVRAELNLLVRQRELAGNPQDVAPHRSFCA